MKKHFFRIALLSAMAMLVGFSACKKDDDDDDEQTPTLIEDGWYVKGDGTALTDYHVNGLFEITRNEARNGEYNDGSISEDNRPELKELYVAVKAGSEGFNIVGVTGGTPVTYGPGSDFAEVANPTQDEPHDYPFWRGTLEETSTVFTVPEDGLYHVIIDTELMKVAVARVGAWGIIGGATVLGWGDDTELPSQGFDLETITFKADNIQLSASNYKFRYSGGWKIEIDTTFDFGSEDAKGLKVNTNYGGSTDNLVPGGENIDNTTPGIYTVEIVWTLGEGYAATLTKTGDVPATDWTDVPLELVGTGVSADNTNAIPRS